MGQHRRSKSSKRWLKEHFSDPYVKQAQSMGYRSRAVHKLQTINEKDKIFCLGANVVDLGAAPGGWSEYAKQQVGENGSVVALDILAMEPIADVEIIQGDFTEQSVLEELQASLPGAVDVVLSDMAPNMSGVKAVDQPRAMLLCEYALHFAEQVLTAGGSFVCKVFQGEGFDSYLDSIKQYFNKVVVRKPPASRARSREVYFVGKTYRPHKAHE